MNRERAWIAIFGALAALGLSSCGRGFFDDREPDQKPRESRDTKITTELDEFVEIVRRDKEQGYIALVGAYGPEVGGTFGASVGSADFDAFDYGSTLASVEVESGWIYIVRPPVWPIVRTPRERGGAPAASGCAPATMHVLAYADGINEWIIFLGAFDAAGSPVSCQLQVDANPPHTSNPPMVTLQVGEYAEVKLDTTTLLWSDIMVGPHPITDSNCPEAIRDLVNYVRLRAANKGMPWNNSLTVP